MPRQYILERLYSSFIIPVDEVGELRRKLETTESSRREMSVGEELEELQLCIEKIEYQKDALVYEPYGLTAAEIKQIDLTRITNNALASYIGGEMMSRHTFKHDFWDEFCTDTEGMTEQEKRERLDAIIEANKEWFTFVRRVKTIGLGFIPKSWLWWVFNQLGNKKLKG